MRCSSNVSGGTFIKPSTMSPSLYDNYPLVTLPRILDVDVSQKVIVAPVKSADSVVIDFAISKSIVASYIIKPSPRLIWSFALSPSTAVDSVEVSEEEEGSKTYFVGITERKKHRILVIKKQSDDTSSKTVDVPHKVVGIKHLEKDRYSVVYENGTIEIFTFEEDTLKGTESVLAFPKSQLVFHSYIPKSEYPKSEGLVVLVIQSSKKIIFKLVSLNADQPFEINSSKSLDATDSKYAYNSGVLYRLDSGRNTITSISIADFSPIKSIDISAVIGSVAIGDISFDSPSQERLLIGVKQHIYLISFKFESILSQFEDEDDLYLVSSVRVNGTSLNTSRSFTLYLLSDVKNNDYSLNLVNVDVGSNKLSESLARSIVEYKNETFKGLPDLTNDNIEEESRSLANELSDVFGSLKKALKAKDVNKWERILVPYLKNEPWSSISSSLKGKKQKKSDVYEFNVFEVEKDRSVDPTFVQSVLSLIFEREGDSLVFVDGDFLPEYTLVYLLTSPLYPFKYTKGLLKLFQESSLDTLLRQAITTCPNLEIDDLILQLAVEENSIETFNELVDRLVEDFSTSQITSGLKSLFSKKESISLDWMINNLLKIDSNNSWNIVSCILDVGGLFKWPLDTVNALNAMVESKMVSLIQNSYNLTLTKQALLINESVKKVSKSKKKKNSGSNQDIISANEQQKHQLDSILTINNASSRKVLEGGSDFDISKKLPTYSVEKLLL